MGAALLLAACGGPPTQSEGTPQSSTLTGELVVFAAASLTESFQVIGDRYMSANPDVTVTFNFGSSSALAQQIISGAPADVFAAAAPEPMRVVTEAEKSGEEPVIFVRNRLEIAVPAGNPGGVTALADFADPGLAIALCAPEVPCGAAATRALAAAGVTPAPDTLEQDVKAALTKVELGEVDAALVYRTDVRAAGEAVEGIEFPEAEETVNDYPILALSTRGNTAAARAFVDYVLSEQGRQVLVDAGFETT